MICRFANLPDSGDFSYNYNPCVSYQGAPGGECTTGVYVRVLLQCSMQCGIDTCIRCSSNSPGVKPQN